MLGIAVVAAAVGGWLLWRAWERPLSAPEPVVTILVVPGSTARTIARQLRDAGLQIEPELFVAAARATGATSHLKAGRYEFPAGLTLAQVLERLRRGDVVLERVTILEGWTWADLRRALAANPELKHDTEGRTDAQILAAIGAAETHPEGLFAPDTYRFEAGSGEIDLLRRAYRAQAEILRRAWDARAPDLPYATPYEALIMASIIEKETGQADERRRIAGVFVNRQRRGMLLQTDPSVIYGLGTRFDGNLRRRDLLADGPYNTYTRAGLPPTPIAMPGQAAIVAALDPESTRALYFVARGDGSSHFSESLTEHNRAVDRYQRGIGR